MLSEIQRSTKLLTKRVDVQVSQLNDFATRFDVHKVLADDRLNVLERVNLRELQEWPNLADLELTEVSVTQVMLLLDSDVPELIVPPETQCGPEGSPVVVCTKIGWTVTGRVPGYIEHNKSVWKVHVATKPE